jgi:hypothetical protein
MELSRPPLVVAFELSEKRKAIVADAFAGASAVVYLTELDEAARAEALRKTGALLTFNTSKELRSGEAELLDGARLIQFMIAGVDFIPLGELPEVYQWQPTAAAMPSRWLSTRSPWHLPPPSA